MPSLRADVAGLRAENERLREIIALLAAGDQVPDNVLQSIIKDVGACAALSGEDEESESPSLLGLPPSVLAMVVLSLPTPASIRSLSAMRICSRNAKATIDGSGEIWRQLLRRDYPHLEGEMLETAAAAEDDDQHNSAGQDGEEPIVVVFGISMPPPSNDWKNQYKREHLRRNALGYMRSQYRLDLDQAAVAVQVAGRLATPNN